MDAPRGQTLLEHHVWGRRLDQVVFDKNVALGVVLAKTVSQVQSAGGGATCRGDAWQAVKHRGLGGPSPW